MWPDHCKMLAAIISDFIWLIKNYFIHLCMLCLIWLLFGFDCVFSPWYFTHILLCIFRNLSYHKLIGSISPDIGKLSNLKLLWVVARWNFSSNIFIFVVFMLLHKGYCIDSCICFINFRALHGNSLYGNIPPEIGNCTELQHV